MVDDTTVLHLESLCVDLAYRAVNSVKQNLHMLRAEANLVVILPPETSEKTTPLLNYISFS
jgi:hypothetical protein